MIRIVYRDYGANSNKGIGSCLTLLFLAVIGSRSKRQYADRAQQVVLASATFDHEGRLMVTPEGLLPCRKITNSYPEHVCSFFDFFWDNV